MASATDLRHQPPPHIAVFPGSGMGHLTPALRVAAMLVSHNCHVTLVTAQPPVSAAESAHITAFLAAYPTINHLEYQIIPYTPPNNVKTDPFFLQFEAIIRSVHLITPVLSSISPSLSAVFSDIASSAGVCQVADSLGIPSYIICVSSARFTAFVSYVPYLIPSDQTENNNSIPIPETTLQIPGLPPFDISSLPPPLFIPNHIFTSNVMSNSRVWSKLAKGFLLNTFHAFEPETIEAVNSGRVIPGSPAFLPIGPLEPHKLEVGDHQPLPWLDQQPPKSVVYVCFGNRAAMSKAQIIELRNGLEESGQKFLWVLKAKIVDKEDNEELEELVGDSFIQRTKNIGLVVKGWVNQEQILSHPSVGGFFSHCGWNSVMEAAARGIPMFSWPQGGDHKVAAEVMEMSGMGIWDKDWGWWGEKLVKAEEIKEKVRMLMTDEKLSEKARKIGEEANNAVKVGGSSHRVLTEIIQHLQHKQNNNGY